MKEDHAVWKELKLLSVSRKTEGVYLTSWPMVADCMSVDAHYLSANNNVEQHLFVSNRINKFHLHTYSLFFTRSVLVTLDCYSCH